MRVFTRLSFRSKIILGITALILAFGLLSAVFVSNVATRAMMAEIKKRGLSLGVSLASRIVEPMLALDFLRLKNMVDEVKASTDDIVYAFVQEENGQVLSHTFRVGFPVQLKGANHVPPGMPQHIQLLDTGRERFYDFAVPVAIGQERLGTVRIGLSQSKARAVVRPLLVIIFGVSAGVALIAAVLGTIFAGTVTRRLNVLRKSVEEVVKGNLDLQVAEPLQRNCWEIKNCLRPECPAYGDPHRRCWFLPGTLCPECAEGGFAQKIETCRSCPVYRENVGDEIQSLAESFDVMALSLKTHIAELKAVERNLLAQRQLLMTILDVTPDLVSLQDENLVYQAVNPAFCQFVGLNEKDIIGKSDKDVFSQDQAERNRQEDLQILRSRSPLVKELELIQDTSKRWLHVVKVPVYVQERTVGLLLSARDITELKQYQEKLVQAVKMEQLGKLAGGVAHEINTPLGIILGYAQMLLEDLPKESEGHEFVRMIEKQTQICRRIVADLLGFSRQLDSHKAEMDLNECISEVLKVVKHPFKQDWVEVEAWLAPDLPLIVGDKEKLKQVWMNLLNNAYDAVGKGGVITVATRQCPGARSVLVTIADNGSGIKAEDLNRVFDPFFTTKGSSGGTGLGLSVSFGIIQDHKGRISAVSPIPPTHRGMLPSAENPGGPGTIFLVELPVSQEEALEAGCEGSWITDISLMEKPAES